MSKTVKNVKNSLKFKAPVKDGVLTVRVGVKKYVLPVQARILCEDGFMFLSFPATSELFKIENNKNLKAMEAGADAADAYAALNPGKRRGGGRRKRTAPEMPSALAEALKAIPAGHKLVFDASGSPRLVKTRKRKAK